MIDSNEKFIATNIEHGKNRPLDLTWPVVQLICDYIGNLY